MALMAAAALTLLSLAPAAEAVLPGGPPIPPIIIIGDLPDVVPPDVIAIVNAVLANVHVTSCLGGGTGAGVDYAGTGAEACLTPGPNGGDCVRVRTYAPTELSRDHVCSDTDAEGRPCVSIYESVSVTEDRTCAGSYPDGYLCVDNSIQQGYLGDRACATTDEHGNPCVADRVHNHEATYGFAVRTCAGTYPTDGTCSATQVFVFGTVPEARTCLGSDDRGNPCVGEVLYLDGGFVAQDQVCAGDYGTDGTCAADRATTRPDRAPEADTRACLVFDGSDPCVQVVAYTSGPSEQVRDRACVRPDGAGPTEPCVTNDVLFQANPITDQGVCVDQTASGATCLVAWVDFDTLLPGRIPLAACSFASPAGQCLGADAAGTPETVCVRVTPEGCVVATVNGSETPVCPEAVTGGDDDGDGLPDNAESAACGPTAVSDAIDDPLVPGSCPAPSDYAAEDPMAYAATVKAVVDGAVAAVLAIAEPYVAIVTGLAEDVLDEAEALDMDSDGVPDTAEPRLCQFENRNVPEDGTCDERGTDYTPPSP